MAYLYGLVYDFVVICIKMYNFKGSKKYDHIHVIVFFTSLKRTWISIWHTFMGLWNDYVVICIKIYNFKCSKKYDGFYVIDFNFAKIF